MLAATVIIAAVVIITSHKAPGSQQSKNAVADKGSDEKRLDGFAHGFSKRECTEAGD
jgi:hypothetical protein